MLGGDCSLLLGAGLALVGRGRFGLVHVDGHTDFRNPSNSPDCASLAGEDLAAVVGRHWPSVSDVGGHGPYFRPIDAVHVGCRDDDAHLDETRSVLAAVIPAAAVIDAGAGRTAATIRSALAHVTGYWLHVDVDVLDPEVMPAVDSPDPGGLQADQLAELLTGLAPGALGASVTIFDPDLDPDGRYASLLTELLCAPMGALGTRAGRSPEPRAG